MRPITPLLTACAFALAFASGCQKKQVKPAPETASPCDSVTVATTPPVPTEAFKITLGSGGGFTGLYTGCTLRSEGGARFWRRMGARPDSTLREVPGAPAFVLELRRQLEADGALKIKSVEAGNMTTVVTLALPDTLYTWSWPGTGVNDQTPPALKAWYPKAEAYCKELNGQGGH